MTKKAPEIRFKGFEDDWEQRKLGDESIIVAGGDIDKQKISDVGKYPVLANALTNDGIVGYYKEEYRVEAPAVTVTGRGDVGHARARKVNFTPVVRLLAVKSEHEVVFLENAINNHSVLVESTGVPQLTSPQLGNYKIYFPSFDEERKIGEIFSNFDHFITLHQRQSNQLELIKQALLQKLFPKAGETIPELRLRGFNEPLGQEKFEKVLKIHPFRQYLAESVENGRYEIVQQGDNPIIGYANGVPFQNFDGVTLFGDHTVSLYKPSKPFFIATDGVKILSGEDFNGKYLYTMLERFKPKSQGYKRHLSILKSEVIYYTKNSTEQVKIGELFSQFDRIITLNQNKIKKLTKIKKSLLQKMFI
ncbi:hypothetical protein BW721_02245 [Jeotgalibaca sp. PTS2502]|uniref:restriction endonuclease subunit S n=1 Tax=Jeotgalibaca sp. PTS2502 TaxID=1903686 RepID=UPI0009736952|nr:restriction endonuclease subunit S [Jeotgalibaca sp. PTS2502]APZ48600.1 hypothetical protein BW721_02245 [Jeotgalibaca sp. PTS2502]